VCNLYPNGLPIHNPGWNVPQQPNYESDWLARLVELEQERDALALELSHLRPEWKAMQQERDVAINRAEAAEAEVKKLTAMLNGQERLAQRNAKEFDKAQEGVTYGVMVAASLYQQWQEATTRAEAAEAALAAVPVEALRRTLLTGYRTDAQIAADADAINVWLQEAQP